MTLCFKEKDLSKIRVSLPLSLPLEKNDYANQEESKILIKEIVFHNFRDDEITRKATYKSYGIQGERVIDWISTSFFARIPEQRRWNMNKKTIITGTSRGIGKAIAEEFLKNGEIVIGMDRLPSSIQHENYTHIQKDLFLDELPEIKDVEILINNAGGQNENDIDNNLKATIKVTEKYAFQEKIESVLFIASASGSTGAEFPEYVASKGGVIAYMKNVALRIAKYHATSNSISPGGVITSLNDHILKDEKLYEAVLNETMLHQWSSVEEIGKWAYFMTIINKSMTAQDLLIDNGEAAKSNFIW